MHGSQGEFGSPRKAVDRLYQTALDNAQKGRHVRSNQTDPIMRELTNILASANHVEGQQVSTGRRQDPDLVRAVAIHESMDGLQRSKLQAYLLTTLTYEEIAERVSETPRCVEFYALIAFDVRGEGMTDLDRVAVARSYSSVSVATIERDFIWKMTAVLGGAEVLEGLMSRGDVCSIDELAANAVDEARALSVHKLAEAAKNIEVDDAEAVARLRQMLDDLRAAQPDESANVLAEQIGQLFEAIPFTVGKSPKGSTPHGVDEFDESAIELNCDELMALSLGQELPHREQLLAVSFPDSPDVTPAISDTAEPSGHLAPTPEQPSLSPKVGEVGPDATASGPPSNITTQENMRRFVTDRIDKERREAAAQILKKVEAAELAAQNSDDQDKWAHLDGAWIAFVGDSQGQVRNRRWREFQKMHPGYQEPIVRKRLKDLQSRANGRS